jgi:shikimate kinase
LTLYSMNLTLIGYRGTGKTTVAQLLAARLGWQWFDADVELERQAGKAIKQIFAEGGEAAFRDWEEQIVAELTAKSNVVIAMGGGAILRPRNRVAIKTGGKTAWLTAQASTLLARIDADATTAERRPNLTAAGGLAEIEQLLAVREPLYRDCADCIVATDGRSPESIAEEIVRALGPALGVTK